MVMSWLCRGDGGDCSWKFDGAMQAVVPQPLVPQKCRLQTELPI